MSEDEEQVQIIGTGEIVVAPPTTDDEDEDE